MAAGEVQRVLAGADLRARRAALGLSQAALASTLGLTANTVARWERGERPIRNAELLSLALSQLETESAQTPAPSISRSHAKSVPASIPLPLTSFVGRREELHAVRQMLGATRFLTLVGPAGVGKTRLALEVARELGVPVADQVCWVELAPVLDPDEVVRAVAAALGVHEKPGRPLTETLIEAVSPRPRLIVVDNCEHLIGACAELAELLLRACPGLRMLATSREAMNVPGETTWQVPALSMPALASTPSIDDVARSDAVALFVARANAHAPFTLTPSTARTAAEICRRLDGIPLAIELAAARVGVLGLEELNARLDDRFRVLVSQAHGGPTRQQTLWAAVDWSYALLTEPERRLFERLAVFVGGFVLEAASAIGSDDELEPTDISTLLTRLVDKSMVTAEPVSSGASVRYRLLETLRQYGLQRLAERSQEDDVRRRHAVYCVALAERAGDGLWGVDERSWLARLDVEHDNLRAALDWCLERDVDLAQRLAKSLWGFWLLRGFLVEGDRWMQLVLSRATEPRPERAATLLRACPLLLRLAAQRRARTWLEDSRSISAALSDVPAGVEALHLLSVQDVLNFDLDQARARLEYACALASRADLIPQYVTLTHSLGVVIYLAGDFERAQELLRESVRLFDALDQTIPLMPSVLNLGSWMPIADARGIRFVWEDTLALFRNLTAAQGRAYALANLGSLARVAGAPERAELLFRESLASFERTGDHHGVTQALAHLGNLAVRSADLARARRFLDDSLALRRELGDARGIGLALLSLARLDLRAGNRPRAQARYAETLQHFREMGDAPGTCYVLDDLADLAIQSGDPEQAETCLSDSLAVRQRLGDEWSVTRDGAVGPGFTYLTYAIVRGCLAPPPPSAAAFLHDLLDLQRRWRTANGLAILFQDLADAAVAQADYSRAARLFGQAAALGGRRYIAAGDLAQERWPETDPGTLAADWEHGRMLSPERALAYALAASPTASTPDTRRPKLRRTPNRLTQREQEVLRLVVQGLTNRAIAARLVLSERTVAKHLDNIFRKTGVTSRAAATAFALRSGID